VALETVSEPNESGFDAPTKRNEELEQTEYQQHIQRANPGDDDRRKQTPK